VSLYCPGVSVADFPPRPDLVARGRRVPGRRGTVTRQRLLETTAELLESEPYRSIKVVDIARRAGTSPATFYQYFPDVEHAVFVLAETAIEEAARLARGISEDLEGGVTIERARDLVARFMAYWDRHGALLRVLDFTTGEDGRFRTLRTRALNAIAVAFSEIIQAGRAATGPSDHPIATLEPFAAGGVLVSMLNHVAAHRAGFNVWGISTADLVESQAAILLVTLTGGAA
jgi:AcrR family transcriptional regulator